MTSTFCPASASATARLQDVSVLPVPPFGPRTQTSRPSSLAARAAAPLRGARAIALLMTNRSCSFVCGNSAMSAAPTSNARRRKPLGDDVERTMIGRSGDRPVRAVDDLERAVVLTALARDEQHVDLTALERADRVVDAVGDSDELEARVVGQGSLHVEGVQPFDGDECADERLHGVTASCELICWRRSGSMIAVFGAFFASPAGRSRNQSVPESAASASF